nr:FlgD immunoglobulin-like domain containing protein [uncultured Treponema sp.]
MFSLFNRLFSRIFDRLTGSKKVVAVGLMMAVAFGGIWAANYTDRDKTIDANWNASDIWKIQTVLYVDTTSYPKSSSDNLYLTAKNTTKLTLTENVELSEFIVAYSGWTAGTSEITIDLAGYTLTCDKLTLNDDDNAGVKLTFIDSSAGKTGAVTTRVFDYSDNQNHSLKINDVPFTVTTTYNARSASGTGKLTLEGTGTLSLPATAANDPGFVPPAVSSVTWNGSNGTEWADLANWTGITFISQLKEAATVTIPSGLTNYPIASAATPITLDGDLVIEDGASVIFAGTTVLNTVTSPDGEITTGTDSLTINGTASLKQVILGNGGIFTSNADLTLGTIRGGSSSKLYFNEGTGAQTTTLTNLAFSPETISFGNDAFDKFNMGAGGTGTLDISVSANVTLAGTINSSNLTLNASPSLSANTTLPNIILARDTEITGSAYTLTFNGTVNSDTTAKNLTITSKKLDIVKPLGATTHLNNFTLNGPSTNDAAFEGKDYSSITCDGDFTINGKATFRGDISAATVAITNDMTFGSNCAQVTTTGTQTYGKPTTPAAVTLYRMYSSGNEPYVDSPVAFISTTGDDISFYGTIDSTVYSEGKRPVKIGSIANPSKVLITGAVGSIKALDYIEINGDLTANSTITSNSIYVNGKTYLKSDITTAGFYKDDANKYAQIFVGGVSVENDVNLISTDPNCGIYFNSAVNAKTANTQSLTIGSVANPTKVYFNGNVGGTKTLKSLTFYSDLTVADSVQKVNAVNWNNQGTGTSNTGTKALVTITGNITGDNTFQALTIEGTGTSTISGSNTVNEDFTCTAAGKTISFGAGETQTVNGKFTITGTQTNPITLNSTTDGTQWKITTSVATAEVSFAKVKDSASTNASIKPLYSTTLGNNTNWIFADKYRWLSTATDTDWKTAANWQIESGANNWITSSTYPGENSDEDVVSIVANTNSKYPEFAGASGISISSINIAADTSISLNSTYNIILTAASDQITNKGTVIFKNSGRFIDTAATAKYLMDTAQGTVEYSGSANQITNFGSSSATDYNNLVVNVALPLESGHQIKVNGNLTTTAAITNGQSLYVAGTSTIAGNITTTADQTYTGKVTLNAATITINCGTSNTITFSDDIVNATGITCALTIDGNLSTAASKKISPSSLSVTGTTANAAVITTTGLQEYTGAVTNTGTITVPSLTSGTAVEFKGGYTGTGGSLIGAKTSAGDLTPNPDIVFSGGTQTFGIFTPNNDVVVFKNNVTLGSDLNCYDIKIDTGANLSAGTNSITVNNNWTNNGTFTAGSSTVIVAKDIAGNTTFKNLTINGTQPTVISGNNTIAAFTCETPSKVITFNTNTTQKITNTLTLDGKATRTEITLKSNSATATSAADQWSINTTGATTDVKYVKVQNSNSTALITTTTSVSMGNNINWAIASSFKWTGKGTDADWKTSANWVTVYNSTEFLTNDYPGKWGDNNIFDTVDISTTATTDKWPIFNEADASIKLSKISIGANGVLTLSGTKDLQLNLAADQTPLSNSGKIIYSNSGRIKNNDTIPSPIMDITKGLVVYTGTADEITNINTLVSPAITEPTDYYNLKVEIDIPLGGCITVANDFTLDDGKNITSPNNTAYSFIVKNSSNANTCKIGGNITTTDLQKYQSQVILTNDVTLTANKDLSFESNGTVTGDYSLTLATDANHQANYKLDKNVNVKTLTASVATGKTLSISAGVTVTAKEGFTENGAGSVSLGTDSSSEMTSIKTEKKNINFSGSGTVTLLSAVTLDTTTGAASGDGNVTIVNPFQGKTANSQDLTIKAGTGDVSLQSDMGTATALGTTTISGAKISIAQSKTITVNSLAITNSDILRINKGATVTATTGFTKTGTGLSQITGTIRTNNKEISFNNSTYIDNAATLDTSNNGAVASPTASITIGTSAADDLYISALESGTAQNVNITAGTLDVKGNLALFNGKVSLAANLTTGKDIVLLNGTASSMYNDDKEGNKSSNVSNLFDYHNSARTAANKLCPPSLVYKVSGTPTTSQYPEVMPDGTTAIGHTTYSSSLTGFTGKTITASQNFYDNGVDLKETGWTLKLKDNDNATDSFAEIYNAEISNCTVECITPGGYAWLSAAENCTGTSNTSDDSSAVLTYTAGYNDGRYSRTNTGVAFLRPVVLKNNNNYSAAEGRITGPEIPNLSGTYSVRDNVIRIEFVRRSDDHTKTALIENSNNEITRALASAVQAIKVNNGSSVFENAKAYIDAECTTSTDGKGDIAVFYIKADSITWNLTATGIFAGNAADADSHGNHQTNYTDLTIEKALADVFYTLTDEHKNRICSYKAAPSQTPSSEPGYRFTATATRCAIAEMHITFAIADFTSNKIYLYFDNPLSDRITWKTFDPSIADDKKTESSIKIVTKPSDIASGTYVANPVASVSRDGISENGIILSLTNNLDYSMIEYGIVIKYGGTFLFDNKIHSPDNKVVVDGESHCISDIITSCVDVKYAYDNRNDDYIDSTGGVAPADSIVMRDFTGEGRNNKLFADKNITLVTKDVASADGNSNAADFKYKLVADITPTAGCDGSVFEEYSKHSTRFWFAEGNNPVSQFSQTLNNSTNKQFSDAPGSSKIDQVIDGTDPKLITYLFHNFSEETPCLNWQSGSNVRFLFEVLKADGSSYTINHKYDNSATQSTPLYCARLKNPLDITSIDLWSFIISEPQRQRGGVSIYSNVVNATNKEFCTLEVNMPRAGNLRVIVMTADGNVVQYLENSRQSEGLHYYYWNGTNNAGKAVARGIYFIRVVGPEIEETRKVMVVK